MAQSMAPHSKQEIIFVTGKGGVGKSAVAAGIAAARARVGRKTLLVELGYQSFYKDYFELPQVSYQPAPLRENLDLALWSGPECLKEYARYLLKVESLYRLFFENSVTRSLINIAPALSELAILGKITSQPRRVGPPLPYETVVVDAFATGHFLALLRAPQGIGEAIRFGPMGEQSRSIARILQDPEHCKYYVVSFAEELPVVEGIELAGGIRDIIGLQPVHLFNRVLGLSAQLLQESVGGDDKLAAFQNYLRKIDQQQRQLRTKLAAQAETQDLPFVFSTRAWDIVDRLAEVFK